MTLLHFRTALLALSVAALALTGCPGPDDDEDPTPDAGLDAGDDGGDNGDGGEEPEPEVVTGGAASSAQIQAVRDMTDENVAHDPALPVETVAVTYIRPLVGSDPAGFFVQAEATGPALFVAVDPATIETGFAVGDIVSFNVTGTTVASGQHQVTAITGLTVVDSGFDVATLVQDLSAATDIVTGLDGYESELIQVSAHMAGDIYGCGGPSQCNAITTEGIPAPESNLRFRMSPEVIETHGLRTGCDVVIGPSPMWRRLATSQVSAIVPEDVELITCLFAPSAAVALSDTQVRVTFNTALDASTVTMESFTVTGPAGPLAVDAFVVEGDSVVLTTGAQATGAAYEIAVAETVKDVDGWAVKPATVVGFTGFVVPAKVVINEIAASHPDNCDLIELRVVEAGALDGFSILEREDSVFTFPAGFVLQKDELVVIHFDANDAVCNGEGRPADETGGPTDVAHPSNFAGAYDFWTADTGLTNTDNVLRLTDATGAILDAVFVANAPTGTAAAASERAAVVVRDANEWTTVDGTHPEGAYVDDVFRAHAVQGLGEAAVSMQRISDEDNNHLGDWTAAGAEPTFGALNVGQTALP
jgi:hypothetical protein